jgi:phosphate uptake regulator
MGDTQVIEFLNARQALKTAEEQLEEIRLRAERLAKSLEDSLAQASVDLAAIAAELCESADDLHDLMSEHEETGLDDEAVVITELDNTEGLEGEF